VRCLCLGFIGIALWRLGLLAVETYELSRYERPQVTVAPAQPAGSPFSDPALAALLHDTGLPGGVVGVYARNLLSGAGSSLNGDRAFPAASLAKLPILVEVYKQHRLRRFTWDEQLTVGRDQWTDGSGVLQARVGERLKVGELATLMVDESDNIAANMLMDLVGVESINQTMRALGLKSTRLTDRARENTMPTTTPDDMGHLLEIIATGRLVDAQTSEEVLRLLERKQAQSWLAAGLPWFGKLAHKWGDLPNARHDVGIIFTPRSEIILAVLTEDGSPAAAAEQIGTVSKRVVEYFERSGG
jgi:beta-lactamase class A